MTSGNNNGGLDTGLDADIIQEVQDNARENQMRDLLHLRQSQQGRSGTDALDDANNAFELKSTTKHSVSTARDVGLHTVEKWRGRYWVFAKGRNLKGARFIIDELFFLDPPRLEGWFADLEAAFRKDLSLLEKAIGQLKQSQLSEAERTRLRYLVTRGSTKNNPHIPWPYIQQHGIQIDLNDDPAEQLHALVQANPLHTQLTDIDGV